MSTQKYIFWTKNNKILQNDDEKTNAQTIHIDDSVIFIFQFNWFKCDKTKYD